MVASRLMTAPPLFSSNSPLNERMIFVTWALSYRRLSLRRPNGTVWLEILQLLSCDHFERSFQPIPNTLTKRHAAFSSRMLDAGYKSWQV